ncbi:MAG: c-type cytochrome [Nitrospinae bacterium]|nr:c-type cytochrome [Nitrospinota bacterium]
MELWKKIKLKLISLIVFNLLIWIINSFLYPLPVVFKVAFTVFTIGGFLILVLVDIFPIEGWQGKRIVRNFILSLIYGTIFLGTLWLYTAYYKFPGMFRMTIIVYTLLTILFIILIDLKPLKEKGGIRAVNSLLFLFLIMGGGYTFMGWALPQFDPAYEIERLKPKKFFIEEADEETIILVGAEVFKNNECFNCHDIEPGGIPKRGPALAAVDIGDRNKIRVSVVDPRKEIAKGYEKETKTMPDYYGDQIEKNYLEALVRYLENVGKVRITTEMMPDGWWTDPKVLRDGRDIFEGIKNPDAACHACHGKDGIPLMTEAANLRDVEKVSRFSDADLFKVVSEGRPDTPMAAWKDYLSNEDIWKVIAYINMFHHGGKAEAHKKGEGIPAVAINQPVVPVIPE